MSKEAAEVKDTTKVELKELIGKTYFIPEYDTSVVAISYAEAIAKAEKDSKKEDK